MIFSDRIEQIQESPIRKLIPYADRVKAEGVQVIHLNIGQPDIPTPPDFLEAVRHYDVSVLEYANSRGIKKTLDTMRLYLHNYGLDFDEEEICITNGASEGLSFSISVTCDPGDLLMVFEPFYTNYRTIAQQLGVDMVAVSAGPETNFSIPSLEEMEKIYSPKVKGILFSSPANPSGRVYTEEELRRLVTFAQKHDLWILADEVYREFNYMDRPFISMGDFPEIADRVVLLDSISKKYSACGARIGSIASKNRNFMNHVLKLCQQRLSVSTLDQIGAGAMDAVDDQYVIDNRITYKKRRDVLYRRLKEIPGIKAGVPEGSFYNVIALPVEDAEDFCIWLLENVRIDNTTILMTPAEPFYLTPGKGKNEVRISYCVSAEKIEKAMDILEKGLQEYNAR